MPTETMNELQISTCRLHSDVFLPKVVSLLNCGSPSTNKSVDSRAGKVILSLSLIHGAIYHLGCKQSDTERQMTTKAENRATSFPGAGGRAAAAAESSLSKSD